MHGSFCKLLILKQLTLNSSSDNFFKKGTSGAHLQEPGAIHLNIDGISDIDGADSFPRYFFSFKEADEHTRTFLKWRLWKERSFPHVLEVPSPTNPQQ
jgi:hypothetical protein